MRADDPYLWLEEVQGADALAWVRERNAETTDLLAADDRFVQLRDNIRAALDSAEQLPSLIFRGEHLYNFWQDRAHPRGLWRRATVEGVADDEWEVLLDVDDLARAEGENWVWQGAHGLPPAYDRYLISLSRGGADARVVREFDLPARTFVADGFTLPEAKSTTHWIDLDHIFVGTDFGEGSLTTSGYPRIAKRWRRGTPLAEATTVFEGRPQDVAVAARRDHTPGFERDYVGRAMDFYHDELSLIGPDDSLTLVETPTDALRDVHREWLLVRPRSPWAIGDRSHAAGSLLAFRLDDYLAGSREAKVLFEPTPDTVLSGWDWTRHHLVLNLLRNVHSEHVVLDPARGWSRTPLLGLPSHNHTTVANTNPERSDELLVVSEGFIAPAQLWHGVVGSPLRRLRQGPEFFDVAGLRVEQHWATSDDGTRVPYFHVVGGDPEGPTLLSAYGGFEISRTPAYSPTVGLGWLDRGGSYVVANIRGGGEFGPAWHAAALRENRTRAYADLAAVARDLVDRGATTPARLGVTGGSNGGLLMGVMLTRYPDLFGAIVGWVPLLDMRRYHRLLAGASWIAEYGDPDSDDWSYLARYSPYQNAASTAAYPPVLWLTSTRDDRVHPGHARKMTARLRELGHRVWLYENIEGGHGAAADHEQAAFANALAFEFLWRHLG